MVEHPTADPVPRLEEEYVVAAADELAGGDQPGDAATDDHDVHLLRQGALAGGRGDGVVERAGAEREPAQRGALEEQAAGERGRGHRHS